MGTICMPKPANVKQYFIDQYTHEDDYVSYRALEVRIVNLHTMYAAVERVVKATGERIVFAAVSAISFYRDYWQGFCTKDMDETMGPYQTDCPASILDRLTPTDHEYALAWRQACRERIANPPKPYAVQRLNREDGTWAEIGAFKGVKAASNRNKKERQAGHYTRVVHKPSGKYWCHITRAWCALEPAQAVA